MAISLDRGCCLLCLGQTCSRRGHAFGSRNRGYSFASGAGWSRRFKGSDLNIQRSGNVTDRHTQYLVYEVRQFEAVLTEGEHPSHEPDSERHTREKERLLQRLETKHGNWNEHHARHRLLEALRGFAAYAENQLVELDRLKGLYSHVSRKQKKVCSCPEAYAWWEPC